MDPQKVQEMVSLKISNIYPPHSTKSERYVLKRRAESYQVIDGELYYQCHRKQDEEQHCLAKVVLTPQEANDLFVEFHASAIGAHCGVDKTLHTIHQRYYWPGMKADITKWIAESDEC